MSYGEDDLRTALGVLERLTVPADPALAVSAVQEPPVRAQPRRQLVAIAGAVAVVLAVAAVVVVLTHRSDRLPAALSGPGSTVTAHGVTVQLVLSTDHVAAGSPLSARLVVDNNSGHPIRYSANCSAINPRVTLADRTHPPEFPVIPGPYCPQVKTLHTGRTTIALTFRTWAGYCGGTFSVCGPDGKGPALPSGRYRTVVSWPAATAAGVPTPAPVIVTLTS